MKPDVKYVFLIDANGKYLCEKEKIRFKKIEGEELKRFYSEAEDKTKSICYFQIEDTKYSFGIEATKEKTKKVNKEHNHEKYLEKWKNQKIKSKFNAKNSDNNELKNAATDESNTYVFKDEVVDAEFFYQIKDETVNVEEDVIKRIQIANLRKSLQVLSKDERKIIIDLFYKNPAKTEREIAEELGVDQKTVNRRKQKIFAKIKKIL